MTLVTYWDKAVEFGSDIVAKLFTFCEKVLLTPLEEFIDGTILSDIVTAIHISALDNLLELPLLPFMLAFGLTWYIGFSIVKWAVGIFLGG